MKVGPAFFATVDDTVTWDSGSLGSLVAISEGGRVLSKTGSDSVHSSARATKGIPHTGKGYFEIFAGMPGPVDAVVVGVAQDGFTDGRLGIDALGWGFRAFDGQKDNNNSPAAYGSVYVSADIIGVAFNNGKIWCAINNTYQNGGDPVADTGEMFSGITGTIYPAVSLLSFSDGFDVVGLRTKTSEFTYAPPTGFPVWADA